MRVNGIFMGWLPGKSFGFIKPADGSADIFVHQSEVLNPQDFQRGKKVNFDIQQGPKGGSLRVSS